MDTSEVFGNSASENSAHAGAAACRFAAREWPRRNVEARLPLGTFLPDWLELLMKGRASVELPRHSARRDARPPGAPGRAGPRYASRRALPRVRDRTDGLCSSAQRWWKASRGQALFVVSGGTDLPATCSRVTSVGSGLQPVCSPSSGSRSDLWTVGKESRPWSKAPRSRARNLPRNTRLSTRIGRKNFGRQAIQRLPWRAASSGLDAMHVRMLLEVLAPGVEDGQ